MGCCQSERSQKEEYVEIKSGYGLKPEGVTVDLQREKTKPEVIEKIVKAQALFRGYIVRQKLKGEKREKTLNNGGAVTLNSITIGVRDVEIENKERVEEKESEPPPMREALIHGGETVEGKNVTYEGEGLWRGKFQFKDGSRYKGQFKDSNINGRGVYEWVDGRRYEGEWVMNKMQGQGVSLWADGSRYEGGYWDDKKQGQGVFTWVEGRKYIGGWVNGVQHGEGVLIGSKGKERRGEWKDGRVVMWLKGD